MRFPFTAFLLLTLLCSGVNPTLALSRFTVEGDSVIDQKTNLMWQKSDSYHDLKKGMTWYEALEYVDQKNLNRFGGYSDWRLPKIDELKTLWDSKSPLVSKDGEPIGLSDSFVGGGSYYLWTANERNLDNAWYFGLGQQEEYFNLKELGDLDQGVKLGRDVK